MRLFGFNIIKDIIRFCYTLRSPRFTTQLFSAVPGSGSRIHQGCGWTHVSCLIFPILLQGLPCVYVSTYYAINIGDSVSDDAG